MGRKKGVFFSDDDAPDDFDPDNPYKDPVAMLEMREHLVREKWIDIEKAKILREKVKWCYCVEGINHLQKCRHLVHTLTPLAALVGARTTALIPSVVQRWRLRLTPNE